MKTRFSNFFYESIKNENLKCFASITIQPSEPVLWRSAFGSGYSFESSRVCLYQLCTSGFGDFLPFFLADLLKLCHVGWGEHESSSLSTDSQWDSSLGFSWATQGLSRTCSEAIPVLLWLYTWCHFPVWTKIFIAVSGLLHSEAGSPQGFPCIWLHSLFPLSFEVSRSLPLKKHPHSMMLPPPCFMVGMVFDGWWAVLTKKIKVYPF